MRPQAYAAVANARKHGFNNISIDLIYALPGQDMKDWEQQLGCCVSIASGAYFGLRADLRKRHGSVETPTERDR